LEWVSRGVRPGEDLEMGYAPFQNLFLIFGESKWSILVHFVHCFYRATHMQRIGIARYMLGFGVCLSVSIKAVFYQCS